MKTYHTHTKRARRAAAVLLTGLGLLASLSTRADTDSTNVSVNVTVPDGTPVGLASSVTVSSPIQSLTNLQVTLQVTNGWNGDLYAYVVHNSGFVVLLNRVGRDDSMPFGYSDAGFDVTLDDGATNNIHTYRMTLFGNNTTPVGGPLTGSWVPDGRNTDPATVSTTNTPDTSLSSFNGLNPNGQWTLFVADMSFGDTSTLVSWGLNMAGTAGGAVPPTVTVSPATTNLECGSGVVLTANATGAGTISYQWYDNQTNLLASETGLTLTLSNLHPADSGNYSVIVSNSDGTATNFATVTVTDTAPPTLTMLGADPVTNECHSAFVDPGATASDTCSSVTLTTNSTVVVNTPGTYTVTYIATDGSGNSATNTRTVYVADTIAPVVTLNGANPMTVECHGGFTDPGATANDACAGSPTVTVTGTVDANTPGDYTLTYNATDPSGNTGSTNRAVHVVDTTQPVITQCAPDTTVTAGYNGLTTLSNLTSLVEANDACSGSVHITQQPAAGTEVSVGTNTVVFSVDDGNGNTNTCSATVTVNAAPLVAPTIISEEILGDGTFQLTFSGPEGQPYTVKASADTSLSTDTWDVVSTNTFGASPAVLIDTNAPSLPLRFYRVFSP